MGSSIQGPSGAVCVAAPPHCGTPLTRFVAPQGAQPKAPVVTSACSSPLTACLRARQVNWQVNSAIEKPLLKGDPVRGCGIDLAE